MLTRHYHQHYHQHGEHITKMVGIGYTKVSTLIVRDNAVELFDKLVISLVHAKLWCAIQYLTSHAQSLLTG